MGKNKKTEQISEINVAKRILVYVFLFAFLGVYPIITNDKYFDITKTRYTFLWSPQLYL